MEISSDPYEQKLYHMFKSHDQESTGTLDETSLIKLCNSLELNDQGNVLINSLLMDSNSRVTFKAFKEGLLKFLGTEMEEAEREKTLVITEDELINGAPDSPGREVSPKLVMGTKKYGRRSRPQSLVTDSSFSDSDNETIAVVPVLNNHNKTQKVQRSSSQSEIHGNRRRRPTSGSKLKRCASLPAQKNQRVKDSVNKLSQQTGSVTGQNQLTSSVESLDMPSQFDMIPAQSIIDMWESAGIIDAKSLFSNLGFDEEFVQITQLSYTLEEELRGLHSESQSASLLKASLVLKKAEIAALQQAFRQLVDENKKLYADNRDANKRVAMLAQEIDERHANLEDTTKSEIRMLEQRHAEVIRELTSQLVNDRENWSNLNARLERRIKALETDESKLKIELQTVQEENSALEKEQISLQKQITELLENNIKLNNEIVELEERQRSDENGKGERETEEVLELIDKITSLQIENANLRDKNDELAAEIEGLNLELCRNKNKKASRTNLDSVLDLSDDPEPSSGVKRRGDSPSKTRITEESPRLGKLRKCSNDNSESETSGDWVALNSELGTNLNSSVNNGGTTSGFSQDFSSFSESKDEEIKYLREKISALEKELNEYKNVKASKLQVDENGEEKDIEIIRSEQERFEARCQDLENSLEQMRKAYEDCEDYWQSKLNDERQLFEKERQIYEDEQQESDKKFTELMEKVREYEDQFSKDGRLSPIEEKDQLEQQYADLEAETEEIKENAKKIFEEKTKEISQLHDQIQDLRTKLGDNIEASSSVHLIAAPSEIESPASSPISYLWNQSTIQAPARDYQNPNWNSKPKSENGADNLTTSETTIFSTSENDKKEDEANMSCNIQPIQKPHSSNRSQSDHAKDDETTSNASGKSFDSRSIASTHSINKSSLPDISNSPSPSLFKEELKRLKYVEVQLKEQIKDLAHKRDSLVMELQQLQEAKPVLEKAYARAAHPTLLQRVNQLEQKNRHLQTVLRQQQHYTESIMHQTWQQQRSEISELRNRIETQAMIMTEQAQRLANADILVKDLYVENSHLTATIQRLEQQRSRTNLMHQHQGLSGVPGMP